MELCWSTADFIFICMTLVFFLHLDSNQLKCFTDVCKGLTEDQFDQYDERRLTQLYNVGEHFACIIYDLPESIGFNEFFEKCQIIANTLIKRFHLVGDMVSMFTF